jgi:glyoxylase-like metal-dependent hydrolase (beta-lactamase superfamily II)
MSRGTIRTASFMAAGFGENAYLVWREGQTFAVAIDPGGEATAMADRLAEEGLFLEAILLTHAHVDHVEGVGPLVGRTGAAVYLHPADRPLYDRAVDQARAFGLSVQPPPPPDHAITPGQDLVVGDIAFQVRHVPGHSLGHVLFYLEEAGAAFTGDVVFQGSIGRTDLPGGSLEQLMTSLREQVLTLPPDTRLLTGHGPATTVRHEATTNPFVIGQYGGGFA